MTKNKNDVKCRIFPVKVEQKTIGELSTLLEYGLIEVADIPDDLVEAVINYQFN